VVVDAAGADVVRVAAVAPKKLFNAFGAIFAAFFFGLAPFLAGDAVVATVPFGAVVDVVDVDDVLVAAVVAVATAAPVDVDGSVDDVDDDEDLPKNDALLLGFFVDDNDTDIIIGLDIDATTAFLGLAGAR
jgi:hypothetical protein